jgi:hypothetical protein
MSQLRGLPLCELFDQCRERYCPLCAALPISLATQHAEEAASHLVRAVCWGCRVSGFTSSLTRWTDLDSACIAAVVRIAYLHNLRSMDVTCKSSIHYFPERGRSVRYAAISDQLSSSCSMPEPVRHRMQSGNHMRQHTTFASTRCSNLAERCNESSTRQSSHFSEIPSAQSDLQQTICEASKRRQYPDVAQLADGPVWDTERERGP